MAYQSLFASKTAGTTPVKEKSGASSYRSFFGAPTIAQPSSTELTATRKRKTEDENKHKQEAQKQAQEQQHKQKEEAKANSLFGKVKRGATAIVDDAKKVGSKSLNTVAAGVAGSVGVHTAAAQALTGDKAGAKRTLAGTNQEIDKYLTKGIGGHGAYLTPEQSKKGGTSLIKPIAQGATDITPYVLPGAGGTSLLAKVSRSAAANATTSAGTTLANEAIQGRFTTDNGGEALKSGITGAIVGAAVPLLHGAGKVGAEAVSTKGAKEALDTAKRNTLLKRAETSNRKDSVAPFAGNSAMKQPEAPAIATPETPRPVNTVPAAIMKEATDRKAELPTPTHQPEPVKAVPTIKAYGREIELTEENGYKAIKTSNGTIYQKPQRYGTNAQGSSLHNNWYDANGTKLTEEQAQAALKSAAPETPAPKPAALPEQPAEPKTLKPHETAHMESVNGYTHSAHLEKDYAEMIRGQEQAAKGGEMIPDGQGGYKRTTEHSQFYRDYYAEHKRAPNKAAYLEEAKRQLASGHAGFGASDDYKALLEREGRPIPRMEIDTASVEASGATVKSKLAQGVQQKAIAAKLTKSLGDLPEYSKVNMKEQAQNATELLASDEQKAINIALGKEAPPSHLLPETVFTAVENKALEDGNVDLLRALANGTRSAEATAMGQRIRALADRNPDSAVGAMKQVTDARVKAIEKKTGKTVAKATSSEIKAIRAAKKAVPKPTKESFASFVESLKC